MSDELREEYTINAATIREFFAYGCGPRHTWADSEERFDRWLARERAAAKFEQREADAVITDGPHPANSGLDSFTLAHIGFAIRAAGTETGETS